MDDFLERITVDKPLLQQAEMRQQEQGGKQMNEEEWIITSYWYWYPALVIPYRIPLYTEWFINTVGEVMLK